VRDGVGDGVGGVGEGVGALVGVCIGILGRWRRRAVGPSDRSWTIMAHPLWQVGDSVGAISQERPVNKSWPGGGRNRRRRRSRSETVWCSASASRQRRKGFVGDGVGVRLGEWARLLRFRDFDWCECRCCCSLICVRTALSYCGHLV
jgi:hypothetical protein